MQDRPAPALDQAKGRRPGRQRAERRDERTGRQPASACWMSCTDVAHLFDAHHGPRIDIADSIDRHVKRESADMRQRDGRGAHRCRCWRRAPRSPSTPWSAAISWTGARPPPAGRAASVLPRLMATTSLKSARMAVEFGGQVQVGGQVVAHAAEHDAVAQQPVAGQPLVQPQQPFADAETAANGQRQSRCRCRSRRSRPHGCRAVPSPAGSHADSARARNRHSRPALSRAWQ